MIEKLKDCDLCKNMFYPDGKCPKIKWKNCKKRNGLEKSKKDN